MTLTVVRASKAGVVRLGLTLAICTLGAAQASAASIVYVKDANVWIASPDGSGPYQVTQDGTATTPYVKASQSDSGVIVAHRGQQLLVLQQNGAVVRTIDQANIEGPPSNPQISPDGTLIVHEAIRNACGVGNTRCATGVVRGIDGIERGSVRGGITQLSWIANTRLIGGIGAGVWYSVVGSSPSDIQSWFDTFGLPAPSDSATLSDPEVSPAGDKVALLANPERLLLYSATGPVPAVPTYQCTFQNVAAGVIFEGPSWSPDGTSLAWAQGDGIWSMTVGAAVTSGCPGATPTRIIPGGKGPDWGPANVNPGARPATPTPTTPGTTPPVAGGGPLIVGLTARKVAKLGALRSKGFKVSTSFSVACNGAVALVVQKGEAKRLKIGNADTIIAKVGPAALEAGAFSATLKLGRKYTAALKSARKLTAFVISTCVVGSGKPVVKAKKVVFGA